MAAKNGKKRGCFRIALLAALLLTALVVLAEQNLSQTMLDIAYARAYSIALETVNRAVQKALVGKIAYQDLVDIMVDNDGRVVMLQANTVRMNEIATNAAIMAEEELNSIENQMISIPLGSALGVEFLVGFGPRIDVQIIPIGSAA